MKQISGSTFYFKKLFPTFWFGFLAFFVFSSFSMEGKENEPAVASLMFLAVPILMAVFGFILFKKMVWDLADRVYDRGDSLEFHKGGKVQRVPISEIVNIGYSQMTSPERIAIRARNNGPIGKELVFMPPMRLVPFSKNPLAEELIERVDRARRSH